MPRWMPLALLCLALPAFADRPRGGPPKGPAHGPMRDLAPADEKAIHDYRLSTSNTDKLVVAGKRVQELYDQDKALDKNNPMTEGRTFDDSVKRIEAHPQAVSAMKNAGVTPREFVVGTFALMTAAMWSQMKKSYPQAVVPAYVNPENMKFIDAHPEVLQKFQAAFDRDNKKGRPRGGADRRDDASDDADARGDKEHGDEEQGHKEQ